jgi:hypothetical protein
MLLLLLLLLLLLMLSQVRTILSQNTTDITSQRAFSQLKAAFPTWEAVRTAASGAHEHIIVPSMLLVLLCCLHSAAHRIRHGADSAVCHMGGSAGGVCIACTMLGLHGWHIAVLPGMTTQHAAASGRNSQSCEHSNALRGHASAAVFCAGTVEAAIKVGGLADIKAARIKVRAAAGLVAT